MGFVVDLIKGAMIHSHSWKDILPFGDFTGDFRIVGNLTVRGSLIQEHCLLICIKIFLNLQNQHLNKIQLYHV